MAYGDTAPTATGQTPQRTTGTPPRRYSDPFQRRGKTYRRRLSDGKAIPVQGGAAAPSSDSAKPSESQAARYARLANNPATRASVPDKFLSPDQLRQRRMNQRLAMPVAEGSNLTMRDLSREANSDTTLRYAQAEGELARQLRDSQAAEQRLPTFIEAYRKALADAQTNTAAAYNKAAQGSQAMGQADTQQTAADSAAQLAEATKDAQTRGASVDPEMLKRSVDAAAVRQANANTVADLSRAQGANSTNYYASVQGNLPLKLQEQVSQERGRRSDIQSKIKDLLLEKGAFNQSQRGKIMDRERSAGMEKLVLGANIAESQGKLAQQQAEAATAADSKRQEFIAKYGVSPEKWRGMTPEERRQWKAKWEKAGKNAPKGSTTDHYGYDQAEWDKMSPEQRREAKAKWDKAGKKSDGSNTGSPRAEPDSSLRVRRAIAARTGFVQKYARDSGLNLKTQRGQVVAALRKTHPGMFDNGGIQEKSLSAAIDLATDGQISRPNIRWLRDQYGVYITTTGGYWGGGNRGAR